MFQTQMDTVQTELREIIGKYGLPAVYGELQNQMRDTYAFLRQVYEPPKNNLVIPISEKIPDRIVTPRHKPIAITVNQEQEPPSFELTAAAVEEEKEQQRQEEQVNNDPTLKEVVIQARSDMMREEVNEKFSKTKHREDVLKKHKELTEKGIKPESLLTKENLTEWLGKGMSYMKIAREVTGVPENEIAAIAKTFGLQSNVKNIIMMKKAGK